MVRSEKRLINAVIGCMRRAFTSYSVSYQNVKMAARIEKIKYKKDGTQHKVPDVFYKCNVCGAEEKDKNINIDHIAPVIEPGKTVYDYGFDEFFKRLNCDEKNLQVICKKCHDIKTKAEKAERKKLRPKKIKNKTKAQQKRTIKAVGGKLEDYVWLEESKCYVHKIAAKGRK